MAHFGGSTITWLGHATVHIQTPGGTSILIDPWLEGNPAAPKDYKLPEKIDLLLITHGHVDHFHDAIKIATQYHPTVIGIAELTSFMETKGVKDVNGMNYGGTYPFKDVRVSVVEAKHSSGITDGKTTVYAGNPCGFMLEIDGAATIYFAGDTSVFGDMQLFKELYAPVIGFLPIGDNYTMGPKHAALAAKYLGLKTVVPVHYGTFPVLTGTPEELKIYLEGSGIEVVVPKAGESTL